MKVIEWKNGTALVRVFLAPGVISPQALTPVIEKFEYFLAELSTRFNVNVFLKRVFRAGDYYALVAVESDNYEKVLRISAEIERRTSIVGSKLKRMLSKAIEYF